MIAALFVERNGCYWNLDGVDPLAKEDDELAATARDREAAA